MVARQLAGNMAVRAGEPARTGSVVSPRVLRRARTAVALPGRVVAVEDRCSALEARVALTLEELRSDVAELRDLVARQVSADADATALIGSLLRSTERRLAVVEDQLSAELGTALGPRLSAGDAGGQ